jgi:hypothetical protein
MTAVLTRLARWLFGVTAPLPERTCCDLCERGHHVHDVHSGRCVTVWCRCGGTP